MPNGDRTRRGFVKAAALTTSALLLPGKSLARSAGAIVETAAGRVRGSIRDGVHSFLGVPYGASTAGSGRFLPPAKPRSWSGVRQAVAVAPVAPQTVPGAPPHETGALAHMQDIPPAGESEDCLYVNVWTPGTDTAKRPVMVWIHGGAFAVGSGSLPVYDGAQLAKRGDVVIVNVNHRLNVLGYAALGGLLGSDYAQSGLVGMLDIVEALTWVRDNIAQFGGDPDRVTIFGESGGGGKVSTLLAMPQAKGLFHQAIVESGSAIFLPERPDAERVAHDLLASMGLADGDARQLLTMPLADLMKATFGFMARSPLSLLAFQPSVDGHVLPRQPFYPGAPASSSDVALMVGTNLTESALIWMEDPASLALQDDELARRLATLVGARDMPRLLALYRSHYPWASATDLWMLINTERGMRRNLWRMADERAAAGAASTFVYHFRFETPYKDGKVRTPHFLEVPLIFRTHHLPGVSQFTGSGPAVDRMSDTLSDLWLSFARTGKPAAAGVPPWRPYALEDRQTMILNTVSALEADPDADLRRYWQSADYQVI